MADLLFEIGCEEIPARFMEGALRSLRDDVTSRMSEARIDVGSARVLGTPRRLVLWLGDVASVQQDLQEERSGPPLKAAYRDGQPTKAAQGFARGQGVEVEDLYTIQTPKGEYVAARVFEEGRPSAELIPEMLTEAIRSLNFPKSMRWADHTASFARPVRWIVALLGDQVMDVEFAHVRAGRITYGHRFAAPALIELGDARLEPYISALREAHVVVEPEQRREAIGALCTQHAQQAGGVLVEDEALVDEVTYLIELPNAVLVRFDEDYLELPDEVLISSMRGHQRYFAVRQQDSEALTNACVVIYNTPVRDADVVRAGNLRVLKARLDDARFFWKQDLQRSLQERVESLGEVVWLKKLGSMRDRSQRMSRLAGQIAGRLGLNDEARARAERAALLAKADLVTNMVYEFPDLQGVMGRAYAEAAGEHDAVAQAIQEQYLPRGADDALPQSDEGACVALAERLDAMVGIFGLGLSPRSSADPYGMRRAALGVVRILQERGYTNLSLSELIGDAHQIYVAGEDEDAARGFSNPSQAFTSDRDDLIAQIAQFVTTRLQNLLVSQGFAHDVVDSVLAVEAEDVVAARDRVEALATLRHEADFEPLATGFKRVVNILRKQADDQYEIPKSVDTDRLEHPLERALYDQAGVVAPQVREALQTRSWEDACRALITLKGPIDAFFDQGPQVMTPDEELRRNRLALLDSLREMFLSVADISRIQTTS